MKTLLLILLSATAACGQGTVLWDESANGQLSQFAIAPTAFGALQAGSNSILASVEFVPAGGGPGGTLYSDFYTFSVGVDKSISSVFLTVNAPIAIWIGDPSYSTEVGSVISPTSGDLLPQIGIDLIRPGEYGVYVSNQDFGSTHSIIDYRLDFFVQAIPEPGTFWLVVAGAGLVGLRGWRKAQRVRGAR